MQNRYRVRDELFGANSGLLLDHLLNARGEPFEPTDHQVPLLSCNTQYQCWLMGRRAGKSTAAAVRAIMEMMKPGRMIWVVAPYYDLTEKIYRQIYYYVTRNLTDFLLGEPKYSRNGMSMKFITGSEIICKTASKPDQLIGESLDLAIIDEAGVVPDLAIEYLKPGLMDINPMTGKARGKLIAVGTPRLHNWFKELYDNGMKSTEQQIEEYGRVSYSSFTATTFSNPHIDHEAVNIEIKSKPHNLARQEYFCEWQSVGGLVFPITKSAFFPVGFRTARAGAVTYIGVDIGKTNDYTVVTAFNPRLEMLGYVRLNNTDWSMIVHQIESEIEKFAFNGPVVACVDETGVGSPIFETLTKYFSNNTGITLVPINFSKSPKEKITIVENMRLKIADNLVKFWDVPDIENELTIYAYTLDARGNPQYAAPQGKHDDIVTSAGLAIHGMSVVGTGLQVVRVS